MKTIKVQRVLLGSVIVTDEAIEKYHDKTLKKLRSIIADVSKNNIICDSIDKSRARFQCAEGYSVLIHFTNVDRKINFYHEEVVIE